MASKGIEICLVLVLAVTLHYGAAAQSGCTSTLIGLAPCMNYVTGNSSTPSSSCCSQLNEVVQTQPQCLCAMVTGGSGSSLGINQTLALSLPEACDVQTPPISGCNAVNNGPPSSTISPPSGSSEATPASPGTGPSKTFPITQHQHSSDASVKSMQPLAFAIFIIFVVSYASNIIKF